MNNAQNRLILVMRGLNAEKRHKIARICAIFAILLLLDVFVPPIRAIFNDLAVFLLAAVLILVQVVGVWALIIGGVYAATKIK